MTNYIIIGTDCSGKTTLVNQLADLLDMKIVKGSSFEHAECSNMELFSKFCDFLDMDNTVFDRFSYCNKVYASLYNDYAMLNDKQRRVIEKYMSGNSTIIYLYADDDTLAERLGKRGDDYIDLDTILKARTLYEEELENIKYIKVVKYDTSKMTTAQIIEDILLKH